MIRATTGPGRVCGSRGPVIVLGMHRSGTTLVARVLARLGVHMGWRQESNAEALFFLNLNNWLLRQSGAVWDRPEPMRDLLANPAVRTLCREYLESVIAGPRTVSYWGNLTGLLGRGFARPDFWGWKDPRNTYTLPLWRDIFPDCRVINVTRHGVDVARSLHLRMERRLEVGRRLHDRRRRLYRFVQKKGGFTHSIRCGSLEGSFQLWLEYCRMARDVTADPELPVLELRYEDLLMDPTPHLAALAEFCGVERPEFPERIRADFDPARVYAYRQNPDLAAFADRVKDELALFGYEP